jgi:hypothetical protein
LEASLHFCHPTPTGGEKAHGFAVDAYQKKVLLIEHSLQPSRPGTKRRRRHAVVTSNKAHIQKIADSVRFKLEIHSV